MTNSDASAALAVLSQGTCDFPGCRTPVVVVIGGRPEVNVEYARIRTYEPGDPWDSFDNLLLLCVPHRKTVDRDARAYPAGVLETWRPRPAALRELRDLTEDRLDDLLTAAYPAEPESGDSALLAQLVQRLGRLEDDVARLVRDAGRRQPGTRATTIVERARPTTTGWGPD